MANNKLTQKITLSTSFPLTSFPVPLVFDIIVIFQKFNLFYFFLVHKFDKGKSTNHKVWDYGSGSGSKYFSFKNT
jgi:hypothetical protein